MEDATRTSDLSSAGKDAKWKRTTVTVPPVFLPPLALFPLKAVLFTHLSLKKVQNDGIFLPMTQIYENELHRGPLVRFVIQGTAPVSKSRISFISGRGAFGHTFGRLADPTSAPLDVNQCSLTLRPSVFSLGSRSTAVPISGLGQLPEPLGSKRESSAQQDEL